MGKCFDGIRRLEFGDDAKSIDILGMVSGEGERVSLGKSLKVWPAFLSTAIKGCSNSQAVQSHIS